MDDPPVPRPNVIEVDRVTKRYGGIVALADVSLAIREGEFHAIVGENGAGKSTLMNILAGAIADYDGTLRLRDERVQFQGPRDAEKCGIAIIHQELSLVDQLSAAANIFLGREKRTALGFLDESAMRREAAGVFREIGCAIPPGQPVGRLRVGDQQLVEIARALSMRADILIMDEPTSALTESETERLFAVIEELLGRGVTILYISHKLDEIFRRSDRITVLRDGRVVTTVNRGETTTREITHLMVGREIEETELAAGRRPGSVLLEVDGLSVRRAGDPRRWRLEDVSFSLRRGEVLGIAGLMGSGRTELLECVYGAASEHHSGRILLDGREVRFTHPADALAAGVALVGEDRKRLGLFANMTVRENITLATLREAAAAGLVRGARERRIAEDSMRQLGIRAPDCEAPVMSLSGGNQQKCVIARWLRARPQVLLLDDPTRGVDVGAKAEIYRIVDGLCCDGLGIILTSSELPELIALCDRMLVLCDGRVTARFDRPEFRESAIMEAATAR
jgi:ABC-type sugar transport system ATPase subunit